MSRIGYLTSQYPAPSHTFIRREVAALRERGFDIRTFSVQRTPPSLGELDRDEADRTRAIQGDPIAAVTGAFRSLRWGHRWLEAIVCGWRVRGPGGAGIWKTAVYFLEGLVLADALGRSGIVHLHSHFSNAGANVGLMAARIAGLSWSVTIHGSADFDGEGSRGLGAKIAEARFVACASDYARSQTLRRAAAEDWPRIFVARCGIEFGREAACSSMPKESLRFLSVGRLSREKGQRGLLEAFAQVVAAVPEARLRLVGDGPERQVLEALRGELGLVDCVEFAGAVAEEAIPAELARADVFVLSSLMEGAPVALMEALAFGLPAVAPRIAGIPELIKDGEDGRLFAPANWGELASVLCELAGDRAQRERIADAARVRGQSFKIEQVIAPMVQAFTEVLG